MDNSIRNINNFRVHDIIYAWKDGETYEGNFNNGQMHGFGSLSKFKTGEKV